MTMEELKLKIVFALMMNILIVPVFCQATFWDDLFGDWKDILPGIESTTNSVEITNEANVQSNTGGNVINDNDSSGQIIEGEARSKVHTETIINGQVVESTDINSTSATSSNVSTTHNVEVEDGKANVHQEIEINSEKEIKDYEIDLPNATNYESTTISPVNNDEYPTETVTPTEEHFEEEIENNIFDSIHNFVTELLNGLKSFFQNVFRF